MKKSLLLIMILIPFCGMAQNYCLTGSQSSDLLEVTDYSYDSNNRLISYESFDASDPSSVLQLRDTLEYDANGDCVKIRNYQLLNDIWKYTWYVDYTYDANHNRITRENYNSFDGGVTFDLGGRYEYTYENNRIVSHVMYFVGEEFEHATYTYNSQDMISEIVFENNDPWGGTGWNYSARSVYTYNDQNICTRIDYYYYDNGWVNNTSNVFILDEAGNTETEEIYSSNILGTRYCYAYDEETSINDVVLPINPESTYNWNKFVNRPLRYSWEAADQGGVLHHICDYFFNYSTISVGLNEIISDANNMLQVYPNPTEGIVSLKLNGDIQNVVVMDMNGKTMMSVNGSTLDLSDLSSGLYIIKAFDGKRWNFGKVEVK